MPPKNFRSIREPEVLWAHHTLSGTPGDQIQLLPPGKYRIYGVWMWGSLNTSTWRIDLDGDPILAKRIGATDDASLVPPVSIKIEGGVTAFKLQGGGGTETFCTVLYSLL